MSIIITIIIGFIVGLIAKALMPGRDPQGCLLTTLLGIGGAVLGQYLGQILGLYRAGEPAGFFMSLIGAMLLLYLFKAFNRNDSTP